jgi:hypothetical protein
MPSRKHTQRPSSPSRTAARARQNTAHEPATLWELVRGLLHRLGPVNLEPADPARPAPHAEPARPAAHADRLAPASASPKRSRARTRPSTSARTQSRDPAQRPARALGRKADLYEHVTRTMLARYNVRVRKWRSSMSGCAWIVTYRDGTVSRLIEAPKPKGPMSAAVFLHEIGHHAIGFDVYKPRCLEEYHAWMWSLNAMESAGIAITDRVRKRMADSLAYAVAKAKRRGIKRIPPELAPFER